jgi:hypothetical protein
MFCSSMLTDNTCKLHTGYNPPTQSPKGSDRLPYLAFPIDAHDSASLLMQRGHEDGLGGDAIHVDAHRRLDVVQMHVAIFRHQVDDAVFRRTLKSQAKLFFQFEKTARVGNKTIKYDVKCV